MYQTTILTPLDFVIKKILGYTSLLNFRLLRFFIEGCVSCSSFLGDERIIFASRWWKADEIRTRSWQNGGKCCEIVNSSSWYFYTCSINDWLLLISACFGELDQFSRDAYQVVIQIRARSCSYVGFTRDRLGSTGKKTTGAIMIIVSLRNGTAGRRGRQNVCVWQTWQGYNLHVMSWSSLRITVLWFLQKDLFKGKWCLAKSYFKQNCCHGSHTRFAVFFPLPSCCVSSLILDSRTRLNFIKLHSTLFFFTRKVSMVIYIEEDWALSRSQNGNWHSITCLCYYAVKTRSRTMTVIAFSRENDAGSRVRTT